MIIDVNDENGGEVLILSFVMMIQYSIGRGYHCVRFRIDDDGFRPSQKKVSHYICLGK